MRNSKFPHSWDHLKLELFNNVWRGGLDFNGKSSKLIASAFLDQQDDLGWCRLFDFPDVETPSPPSHFCFSIKAFQTTGIILLQKLPTLLHVCRIENFQPS